LRTTPTISAKLRREAIPVSAGICGGVPARSSRWHVVEAGFGIERLAAPFGSAVEAGEDHRRFLNGEREELAIAAEPLEFGRCPRVRLWRSVRQHIGGEPLAGEWQGHHRQRLFGGGFFARHRTGWILLVLDRKKRRTAGAIEEVDEALLGGLRDSFDAPPVARHRHETRRRRRIAIPDVVADELEVPDPFARVRVERQQTVRESVVAEPIGAVEVARRRSGRHVDDPGALVERHSRPVVGAATILPGARGPRLVAVLPGMWNRVERPFECARADVVRADVSRRGRQGFADAAADDHQIPVDDAGRGEPHALRRRVAAQILAQVDPPACAECGDRLSGRRIERVDEIVCGGEDAALTGALPVHDGAVRSAALDARIERPEGRAGRGVHREGLVRRRIAVQDVVDDDGLRLHRARLAGVVGPGDGEIPHVGAVDLGQR
jgi:hypothetical protein